jgi:SAM-dependent methyltransferase
VSEVDLPLTGERTLPGIPHENYWFRRHVAAYRFARRLARGRIIDAGAGEGYGADLLSGDGRTIVAMEVDPAVAGHGARRYPSVRWVRADLCRLAVRDRSVDAVVALQVLEHLPCAEEFVEGCARVLRPSGTLVLTTPNRRTFPAQQNPFHVHEFDTAELRALLEDGFTDVRVLGIAHRAPLGGLDRFLGEPVQHRLARVAPSEGPWWLRTLLRTVRSWDFRITGSPDDALDLVAVCRNPGATMG